MTTATKLAAITALLKDEQGGWRENVNGADFVQEVSIIIDAPSENAPEPDAIRAAATRVLSLNRTQGVTEDDYEAALVALDAALSEPNGDGDGKVRISVELHQQAVEDLLSTAVEGGSNYWCDIESVERTRDLDYIKVRIIEHDGHKTGVPPANCIVTLAEMRIGLERLAAAAVAWDSGDTARGFESAATHFGHAIGGGWDATTADVVLQMAVFGEVIYG